MRDVVSSAQVPGGAPEHVPAGRRERSSLVAELPAYVCDADRPVQRAGGVGDTFVDPVSVYDEGASVVGDAGDLGTEPRRCALTQFHPSLERVLGPRLDHAAVTWLLERYGSPAALRKAGRRRLVEVIRPKAPAHGCPADRRRLRRPRRADRSGPGNRHPRRGHPVAGPLAGRGPRPAPGTGSPDQQPAGGSPSFTRS